MYSYPTYREAALSGSNRRSKDYLCYDALSVCRVPADLKYILFAC